MIDPLCRLANTTWMLACQPARRRLRVAFEQPRETQTALLQRLLQLHHESAFGRLHGLGKVKTVAEFQTAVPPTGYEAYVPWLERVKNGERDVLAKGPVLFFERSNGSATAAKYIPYTAGLRHEFQEAIRAWLGDLLWHRPALRGGPAYWLVSPRPTVREHTVGGIPIGIASDDEYLGAMERRMAHGLLAVPPSVSAIADVETSLSLTARFLLQASALRILSVWNPSYLLLLWSRLEAEAEAHLDSLEYGVGAPGEPGPWSRALRSDRARARRLRECRKVNGGWRPSDLWPALGLISCWTDGVAATDLPALRELFEGVEIQPKGLFATEGAVTIPWCAAGGAAVPALCSHFLEFLEVGDEHRPRLAHELEEGKDYAVLITTGGGLWRYRLGDVVRYEGRVGEAPCLRFIGRVDGLCDLRGEKLSPAMVERALSGWDLDFAMLAPAADVVGYTLFIQAVTLPDRLAEQVESRLRVNPPYARCREAGTLAPVRIFRIEEGAREAYLRRCVALGQRAGGVTPSRLHAARGWEDAFHGYYA